MIWFLLAYLLGVAWWMSDVDQTPANLLFALAWPIWAVLWLIFIVGMIVAGDL